MQLRRYKSGFDAADARVLLVGMGTATQATDFLNQFDLPFQMVCDPQRLLYGAFGLKLTSPLAFLKPTLAFKGIAAVTGGAGIGLPVGDPRQMPGVFIIDMDGRIIYRHIAKDPSDNPLPSTLIKILNPGE